MDKEQARRKHYKKQRALERESNKYRSKTKPVRRPPDRPPWMAIENQLCDGTVIRRYGSPNYPKP